MDNELVALMQMLSNKPHLTLKDIEVSADITRRQAIYRIEKVNDLLRQHHAPIATIGTAKEIRLDSKARQKLEEPLQEMNQGNQYHMNEKGRQIYMYLMLLMNSEYLSSGNFIDSLGMSRSTVLLNFKRLTQVLGERDIRMRNNRTKGYYLIGSEVETRRIMVKYVVYILTGGQSVKIFDVFIGDFNLDTFNYSRLMITELAQRHNIRLVEDRLVEFTYVFIFLKTHMQSERNTEEGIHVLLDMGAISLMREYEFTVELLENYRNTDNIANTDINYISSWILGISFDDINKRTRDCILISDIIGGIMTRFEYLSETHYRNTEEIFTQLYSHFRPACYRLLCRLLIFNPLCDKAREEYRGLYQPAEETMKPFRVIFGGDIPTGEIACLTMHFASIYSDQKAFEVMKQKTTLVVCSNGIGNSAILYNELAGMFPELHLLPPLETSRIYDIKEYVDIIFSTSYVSLGAGAHAPIIRVSPVISIAERYRVVREVYIQMRSHFLKQSNIDVVIGIIAEYANIQSEHALYDELVTHFSHIDTTTQEERVLHLADMVKPELTRLYMDTDYQEKTVWKAYEPIVQHSYITQNYVGETISNVRIVGSYIVITKHVALPCVKPEAGALSVALGVGVSSNAIESGSRDNDPVKYIFSLSATDNQTHLCAMAELLEMFNRQEFFDMLNQAENSDRVMVYLKGNQQRKAGR